MSQISFNRASYNKVPNIHLGKKTVRKAHILANVDALNRDLDRLLASSSVNPTDKLLAEKAKEALAVVRRSIRIMVIS